VNLAQLDVLVLVLVLFTQDRTVIPRESPRFGSYPSVPAPEREEEEDGWEKAIVSMREQPLYVEDWIGLRTLDGSGRVVLVSCDTEYMRLSLECWQPLVEKYAGSRS
jgi:palmitoyl-protein thioesterase